MIPDGQKRDESAPNIKEKHPNWFKMKIERRELIRQLAPETAVRVLLACWEYLETEEKPRDLSPIESIAFSAFIPDMEEAWKRYLQRVTSGTKGGRPREKKNHTVPYGGNRYHTAPNGTEEETETETEIEPEDTTDNISSFDFSSEKPNKDKSQEKFDEESKPFKLARWLDKQISERSPHYQHRTASQLQKWARTFDLMNRRDGIPWDDIRDVLAFSQEDPFWQTNILSADKFRKQFVQLAAKMDREVERRDG